MGGKQGYKLLFDGRIEGDKVGGRQLRSPANLYSQRQFQSLRNIAKRQTNAPRWQTLARTSSMFRFFKKKTLWHFLHSGAT